MTFESYVLLTIFVAPVVLVNAYVLTKLAVWMVKGDNDGR